MAKFTVVVTRTEHYEVELEAGSIAACMEPALTMVQSHGDFYFVGYGEYTLASVSEGWASDPVMPDFTGWTAEQIGQWWIANGRKS